MSARVLGDDGFCRKHEAACRASALRRRGTSFWRGQLSHVGHHYDIVEDGLPWRVLVLGMETGREREHVTFAGKLDGHFRALMRPEARCLTRLAV